MDAAAGAADGGDRALARAQYLRQQALKQQQIMLRQRLNAPGFTQGEVIDLESDDD